MILLDENIPEAQWIALEKWKPRQIGLDRWSKGTQDDHIAVKLRHERDVTFFTRDRDFWDKRREYGHSRCSIVFINAAVERFAAIVDRFLRHRSFRTHASRKGLVIRVTEHSVYC